MRHPDPDLAMDGVHASLQNPTSFLSRVVAAESIARLCPQGDGTNPVPGSRPLAHARALFGDIPDGGVHARMRITAVLHRHGGLPVPSILHYGERTGPGESDFTIDEVLPGRSFDGETNPMGRAAARQLGDHLGRLHAATARTDGFGAFGGEPIRGTQWWSRFEASYTILADEVCEASSALRASRWRLDAALREATRSPNPSVFPLICIDQDPSRYLGDEGGLITGFVGVAGHLFAPAEWELTTVLMWMPHPHPFRHGYEHHRRWPEGMEAVRDAYATYALMERIRGTRGLMNRTEEKDALEAWLLGALPSR